MSTRNRILRTVVPTSTTCCYALHDQLLNPCRRPIAGRHIPEACATSYTRGYVGCPILGTQQKDGHLGTGDRVLGTKISISTTSRDTFRRELFDPRRRPIIGRHIPKTCASANAGRRVGRGVDASEEEDSHLRSRHCGFRTIAQRIERTAACDSGRIQPFDKGGRPIIGKHIRKNRSG